MASSRDDSSGSESLLDTWLPHSKPAVPNYAHAGVLLALGLNGHLDRLSWTDLYRCVHRPRGWQGSMSRTTVLVT
jgi:anaphase-promoting complex subunit 1